MTNLLQTLRNGITSKKKKHITSRRLNESNTTNDDDLMTYQERNTKQRNDITKHAIISKNTNKNLDNTNDNSDTMTLDDDLIRLLNPEGEVIVDNIKTYQQNDIPKHKTVNTNTNENVEETDDIMKLDDDLIKSVNPEGQVVVDDLTKDAKTDQNTKETTQNTNGYPQNTNDNSQNTNVYEQNTNENPQNTNDNQQNTNVIRQHDNSDKTKLDQDLIKSINPQGEVVVDVSRQPPTFNEQPTKDSSGVGRDDTQNDLMTISQTNVTEVGDSILGDDAFIKSINPAGGVIVNSDSQGRTKQQKLFYTRQFSWHFQRNFG